MAKEILDRLKFIRDLPIGSPLPVEAENNNRAAFMSDLCADAIIEIEALLKNENLQ